MILGVTRLILWDVDHTLIETRGVGGDVFREAFEAATGRPLVDSAQAQGALEPELFAASCRANGVADDPTALFPVFAGIQARLYRERAGELRERGRVLPGAREALDAVAGRDDVVSSVLTGNTEGAGRAKLEAFGLNELLDLDAAAWGTDAPSRPWLYPVAWERARAVHGVWFGPERTVAVGDSPADVSSAQANRVRVLAVASGKASFVELVDTHADRVFQDLTDADAVLRVLLG